VEALSRLTGETIDQFNARLSQKLATVADSVVEKIKQKLAGDQFKAGELAFLFSVMHDKRMALDGRSQLTNASINVQINQIGGNLSKDDLISMLEGRKQDLPGTETVVELGQEQKTG
jgi:hypothetical protein